jgi:hypothetical protein
VKRSRAVHLVLLVSTAVAFENCGHGQCVDAHNIVVDDKYCHSSPASYHYFSGRSGSVPIGSSVDPAGTTRGVFGAAGEAGDSAGAGE